MAWIPNPVSRQHVDEDSDDILQARQNISDFGSAINGIRDYLIGLFGTDGTKGTAIATLFSGQAVLFPMGTNMFFANPTVPPGWIKWQIDYGRYLMAVPDDTGAQYVGNYFTWLQSTATQIIREHLPIATLTGFTNWVGDHSHLYEIANMSYSGGPNATTVARSEGYNAYFYRTQQFTTGAGNHGHTVEVPLGGAGWGHDHMVSMANYRPAGLTGVLGQKT